MYKPPLAWAMTGIGHYSEECLNFFLALNDAERFIIQAGSEALKMYGISLDKDGSSPLA